MIFKELETSICVTTIGSMSRPNVSGLQLQIPSIVLGNDKGTRLLGIEWAGTVASSFLGGALK